MFLNVEEGKGETGIRNVHRYPVRVWAFIRSIACECACAYVVWGLDKTVIHYEQSCLKMV